MNTLERLANWKVILGLFILTGVFSFFLFPHYQGKIDQLAQEELESLDARRTYSLEEVTDVFGKMGKEGREIYIFTAGRIDMVYPLVYGSFFILLLLSLFRKIVPAHSAWPYLSFLPLAAMIADYAENFQILSLLKSYPQITASAVESTCQMTQIKWSFVAMSLCLIMVLGILSLIKSAKPGEAT